MLHTHNFADALRRNFRGQRFSLRADHDSIRLHAFFRSQLLCCRNSFPTDAADAASSIYDDYPNAAHMTRTSNFSFSTSAAAASFAVPDKICVDFCFCGRVIFSSVTTGALSTLSFAAVTRRTSFVLARLMPINVA